MSKILELIRKTKSKTVDVESSLKTRQPFPKDKIFPCVKIITQIGITVTSDKVYSAETINPYNLAGATDLAVSPLIAFNEYRYFADERIITGIVGASCISARFCRVGQAGVIILLIL